MNPIGRTLATLWLVFIGTSSLAEVTAKLDRDRVSMGDTLRLTITATAGEDADNTDLRPLLNDFDILQRSTSSSTRIINGQASNTQSVKLDISPKREGTLRIPPLRVGDKATTLILVSVAPAPTIDADSDSVLFEAEIDRDRVYVQGQLLLTLRVQQSVNLDARSITELQLDDAFVKPLEQRSFQRQVNGRPWLVHEVRYAIFPEQSGTLEIPSQTFTAREAQPRRSLFDLGSGGRPIRRTTEKLNIEVLPRPANFPGGIWLPATNVEIQENWSVPPESLKAGESATRTLRLVGEGLQGAQLPPITVPDMPGLKFYPDQPTISEDETGSGVTGQRVDSAALVPTQGGTWNLPEVRIPWWDTASETVRYAVVPSRRVNVSGAATVTSPPAPAQGVEDIAVVPIPTPMIATKETVGVWRAVAIFALAGWLITIVAWFKLRHSGKPTAVESASDNPSEAAAFKQLAAACSARQPIIARAALLAWANARSAVGPVTRIDHIAGALSINSPGWGTVMSQLESANFRTEGDTWDGDELLAEVKAHRKSGFGEKGPASQDAELALYPT